MKTRLLLLTLALVCVFATSARQLSPDEALARAKSHAVGQKVPAANVVSPKLVRVVGNEKCQSAAYLFTDGTSTLIVSGDDRITPVLGYTDAPVSGKDAPEAFECWLKSMADEVAYAISENLPESPVPSVGDPIEPLLKSTWGQRKYYNRFSPIVGGKQSPTGCVATALAQIMYYHQWPANPVGTASCRTTEGDTYSMDFDGIEFDWSNMTDSYNGQSSESSIEAVSTLMKCVGYGVNMKYGPNDSGANIEDAMNGMIENFNYSSQVFWIRREVFLRQEWEEMLYSMLSANMPVYHTGFNGVWLGSGGHAFVCDGYDGNGYFHFNWGWDGSYNGFFLTSCLVPSGVGTGGSINGYNYAQEVMINLHPNDGKQYNNYNFVQGTTFSYDDATSMITAGCQCLTSTKPYEIGISFSPDDGSEPTTILIASASGVADFNCPLDYSTTSGLDISKTYQVRFVWRHDGDSSWKRIIPPGSGVILYRSESYGGTMKYNGDRWIFNPEIIDRDDFDITVSSMTINNSYYCLIDEKNTFELTATNNQDDYSCLSVSLFFVNVETGERVKRINFSLELSPKENTTKKYTLSSLSDIPEGKYYLELIEAVTNQTISLDKSKIYSVGEKEYIDDGLFTYSLLPNGECFLFNTVSGTPATGEVTFPASVNYNGTDYPVKGIVGNLKELLSAESVTSLVIKIPLEELPGDLSNFSMLENLEFPESLRSIGDHSVAYCRKLKTVKMPEKLEYIGKGAFYDCSELSAINIPPIETISDEAFYNCQMINLITIPEGVVNIGKNAFYNCKSATSIQLPTSLRLIDNKAFYGCQELESLNIPSVEYISDEAFYDCIKLRQIIIPEGTVSVGKSAFYNCNSVTSIELPSSLRYLGMSVFFKCSELESVNIPPIETIPVYAFSYCSKLKTIEVPEGVVNIEISAFSGCTSAISIELPSSLRKLGNGAFSDCSSIESLNLPSVETIGAYAFSDCTNLKEITIPEGVVTIGASAFSNCNNLKELIISEGVATIEEYAFKNCNSVTDIDFPSSLKYIDRGAFYGCTALESLNLPSVTAISNEAFFDCTNLMEIVIPEGTESIGASAFRNCNNAKRIELPSTLIWMGNNAFYSSSKHENIYCSAQTPPSIESYTFGFNDYRYAKLHVPAGTKQHYASDTDGWGKFYNIKESITTGIDQIFGEADDIPEQWFTISGIRLKERPTIPGCYIKVHGDDRQTVMIK